VPRREEKSPSDKTSPSPSLPRRGADCDTLDKYLWVYVFSLPPYQGGIQGVVPRREEKSPSDKTSPSPSLARRGADCDTLNRNLWVTRKASYAAHKGRRYIFSTGCKGRF